uniref:Protein Vpu n=1 Tax=Human immunodeficiency virus type 1 TaxID=11676 RepID=A0A6B9SG40_HV1|nr:vpu protein [Human immunodeficiency virus 1]
MFSLVALSIVALVVAAIIVIVVWTIVFIEWRKLKRQRKIDQLILRIRERAEDSGNESDGDTEELSKLVEVGNHDLGDDNYL